MKKILLTFFLSLTSLNAVITSFDGSQNCEGAIVSYTVGEYTNVLDNVQSYWNNCVISYYADNYGSNVNDSRGYSDWSYYGYSDSPTYYILRGGNMVSVRSWVSGGSGSSRIWTVDVAPMEYRCACNEEDNIPDTSTGWNFIAKIKVGEGTPQGWNEDDVGECQNVKQGREDCIDYNYFYLKADCDCKKGYSDEALLVGGDNFDDETCGSFCDAVLECDDSYLFATSDDGGVLTCCTRLKNVTTDENGDPQITSSSSSTNDDGSTTDTTTTTNGNTGASRQTSTTTNLNGTQSTTTTTTNADGTSTSTTNTTNADGSTTNTSTTTNADGTQSTTSTTTNADGSSTTTTTNADGSTTTISTPPNKIPGSSNGGGSTDANNTSNNGSTDAILASILNAENVGNQKMDGVIRELQNNGDGIRGVKDAVEGLGDGVKGVKDSIDANGDTLEEIKEALGKKGEEDLGEDEVGDAMASQFSSGVNTITNIFSSLVQKNLGVSPTINNSNANCTFSASTVLLGNIEFKLLEMADYLVIPFTLLFSIMFIWISFKMYYYAFKMVLSIL